MSIFHQYFICGSQETNSELQYGLFKIITNTRKLSSARDHWLLDLRGVLSRYFNCTVSIELFLLWGKRKTKQQQQQNPPTTINQTASPQNCDRKTLELHVL